MNNDVQMAERRQGYFPSIRYSREEAQCKDGDLLVRVISLQSDTRARLDIGIVGLGLLRIGLRRIWIQGILSPNLEANLS